MAAPLPEIVIPKEQAVFWLDGQGRWCNRHGPFAHKKIIDHFHRAIARDANGYYVTQENLGRREKIYFRYADTALFVFAVKLAATPVTLVLNTGAQIPLVPQRLFTRHDALYQELNGERIKFVERALWQISHLMAEEGGACWLVLDGVRHRIAEC
jgi:hypothetical protein